MQGFCEVLKRFEFKLQEKRSFFLLLLAWMWDDIPGLGLQALGLPVQENAVTSEKVEQVIEGLFGHSRRSLN